MEKKLKHLDLIQGIINRLATASFQLKGWSVVLVSAILIVVAQAGRVEVGLIFVVPVLVFWFLDAYFLAQERLFRKLYDFVRTRKEKDIDFSMDTGGLRLRDWWSTVRSLTLLPFYIMLVFVTVIVGLVVQHLGGGQ